MKRKSMQSMLFTVSWVAMISLAGCGTEAQNYLLTGAGLGGAAGAAIGAAANSSNPWKGAAIGGLLEAPQVPLAGKCIGEPNNLPNPSRATINMGPSSRVTAIRLLTKAITRVRIMTSNPPLGSPVRPPVINLRMPAPETGSMGQMHGMTNFSAYNDHKRGSAGYFSPGFKSSTIMNSMKFRSWQSWLMRSDSLPSTNNLS